MKAKLKIAYLHCIFMFSACCVAEQPTAPEINTPPDYDKLIIEEYNINTEGFRKSVDRCGYHKSSTSPLVINDTTNTYYKSCVRDYLQSLDFENHTFVYTYLGSINNIIYSDMKYAAFINHRQKKVKIVSEIVGSGGCHGSNLSYTYWYRAMVLPKIPAGYTFELELDEHY